jgi:hypothetical protein
MATPPPSLPMFFSGVVPLDPKRHGELRLDRGRDFRFARQTNAIPLALHELVAAAADFPIVFGAPGRHSALAIVGFRDHENLFVDANGAWRRGAYVPAYVRNYPFAVIESPGSDALVLGIDPQAAVLGDSGAPLFDAAQPAAALKEALELCSSLYHSLKESSAFCAALEEEGLLVENRAVIEFARGGSATITGFRVVDAAKFDAVAEARFLDWRRRGWLAPLYAHLQSTARWARIVDLGAEEPSP